MVFVVKHIKNKHEKILVEMREKIIENKMYENYVKDPHRMMGPSQNPSVNQFPHQNNNYKYNRPSGGGGARRHDSKLNQFQHEKKDYKDYDEP